MVNLDAKQLRFMSAEEFRVLVACEMGMKNHEIVPTPLIGSIAGLKRGGVYKLIQMIAKNKLVQHQSIPYDGFRLTAKGYDFLALKSLAKRNTLASLGIQIGVGKESDIFTVMTPGGEEVCLKLHRLGRTCFRTVKNNRDYIKQGQSASWIYLSRLSALKEFAFMKALYAHGFPVPEPLDVNRHCVVMRLASGYQLNTIQKLRHPAAVFAKLMDLLIRLAEHGLIHGDFNEFNLLVDDEENVTVIDFPQMVSTSHINAEYYFNRDVQCVKTFFRRRFGFVAENTPVLGADTSRGSTGLDEELKASGWTAAYNEDFGRLMEMAEDEEKKVRGASGGGGDDDGEGGGGGDDDDDDDDDDDGGDESSESDGGDGDGDSGEPAAVAAGAMGAPLSMGAEETVDAAKEREAELAALAELAAAARSSTLSSGPAAAETEEGKAADGEAATSAQATASVSGVAGPPSKDAVAPVEGLLDADKMVDLSDTGRLPDSLQGGGEAPARQRVGAEAEATPSERGSVVSSMRSSRAADAKARIKAELRGQAHRAAGRSSGSRNETKDREKRKTNASMRRELAGTSGW
jgi:RIO kinase 2